MVAFDSAVLAAQLDSSALAPFPRVALDLHGWPGPLVAVDVTEMVGSVDANQTFDRLVEIRDTAEAVVDELGWTPVVGDVPFPADGLVRYYATQMVPYRDPGDFNTNLADPRWGLQQMLLNVHLFVPDLPGLTWDPSDYRQPGPSVRSEDEINGFLEIVAERLYEPLGARPDPEEVAFATDPDGEQIRHLGVAGWWMHRWATNVLSEPTLIGLRAWPGVYHTIDDPTLFLLPSANPAVVGLLPSGSGEFSFAQGHQAWAEFVAKWHKDWGAKMVSCGPASTFTVENPPTTVEAAIPLAVEHWFFFDGPARAADSVYEYAYSLVDRAVWLLSVKP